MEYVIESTKTNAGTRKLPMTEDVYQAFKRILENRPTNLPEIMVAGHCGFLFRDSKGMPEVAMHWSIGLITRSRDTTIFSESNCLISPLTFADIPTVQIWQRQE